MTQPTKPVGPAGSQGTPRPDAADDRLSRYLAEGAILDQPVSGKDELLQALVKIVIPGASPEVVDRLQRAVLEREASVNTYVGGGVAIPHARLDDVGEVHIALARSSSGFPYGRETDQPVRVVVLIVGPESAPEDHVRVLAAVARVLQDPERRDSVVAAPTVAAIRRLLDHTKVEPRRRRPRALSQVLLEYAARLGRELGVKAIILSTDSRDDLEILRTRSRRKNFIVATTSQGLLPDAERTAGGTVLLPKVPLRREARIRLASLMALTHGLIARGDTVAVLSSDTAGTVDSLTVIEIGREFGRIVTGSGDPGRGILPVVVERALTLATELSLEGREGRPVGTIFVIGDPEKLGPFCQQMVMNPFRGCPEEERNLLDPTLAETIKEFAAIDGAFVIRGDGVVVSAGTYLKVSQDVTIPGGYGSRHRVACAITGATSTIAVSVSQSTGEVTLFKDGGIMLSIPRGA